MDCYLRVLDFKNQTLHVIVKLKIYNSIKLWITQNVTFVSADQLTSEAIKRDSYEPCNKVIKQI